MTSSAGAGAPDHSLFLETTDTPPARPNRPLNQGDIFQDVAITLTNRSRGGSATAKTKLGHAMLIGHPCSLRGGSTLAVLQNIAQVRPVKEAEAERLTESPDSDSRLFRLDGLFPDTLWVVDFNILGTVHFKLLEKRRIACLSLEGWAAFQRRYANHALRVEQSIELRIADIRKYWLELDVWEEWCVRGNGEEDFYEWIREPITTEGPYAGTTRFNALELAADVIRGELPARPG